MGGIFSRPKAPDTSAADKLQKENMEKQQEINEKQEKRLDQQEKDQQSRIAARLRARRTGGRRMLLSSARTNAATGIKGSSNYLGG